MRRLLLGFLAVVAGCGASGTVVAGPQDISSTPREVAFLGPVPVAGPKRHLCLDFDPPGESRKAASLHAVLVTVGGRRDSIEEPAIDRRGESRVCLLAPEPAASQRDQLQGTRYRAVELRSTGPPVHIRAIRWWSGR